MSVPRPAHRDDFEVTIICALPLEYNAISYIFDEFWDEDGDQYGRAAGDPNSYTTGRVGKYNVVLALLPHMGKTNAASTVASMRASYGGLRLALLVGVCGGMPRGRDGEILLGDVVISKTVIQNDFGRQYSDKFIRKNTVEDNLGRPNKDIRNLVALFETHRGLDRLEQRTAYFLQQLQAKIAQTRHRGKYDYPGTAKDKLFESAYRHKHHVSSSCICRECFSDLDPVCSEALSSSCTDLGCDDTHLVARERLQAKRKLEHEGGDTAQQPVVHVGIVASGDTVLKSATDRDRLSREAGVIAFEMEGAGVWDEVPCIVVKGVCDYADSHKHKEWQNFAAATAASTSKAILECYIQTDKARDGAARPSRSNRPFSTVPFAPDPKFIKRADILLWLRDQTAQPGSRVALVGLGGVGKSQIAIHYMHEIREASPDTWVFWVHASSRARFEEAYRNMADKLQLPGRDDPKRNVLQLVYAWLCDEENGPWMMVLDNADSIEVFFPRRGVHGLHDQPLASFLPKTGRGSIVITSRNTEAAERLAGLDAIYNVPIMKESQALQLLRTRLGEEGAEDNATMSDLVDELNYMPLAITQAAAYIKRRGRRMSVSAYLDEFRRSDKKRASLLNTDAGDLRRDESASNSIATTWQITFEQIRQERPLAADLLSFMSFFNPQGIPESVLQAYARGHRGGGEDDLDEDLEVLRGYSLLVVTADREVFEMHALVQFCTRVWLLTFDDMQRWEREFLKAMSDQYPSGKYETWTECRRLDPHLEVIMKEKPDQREDILRWARLLTNVGWHWQMRGRYNEAELINRQALEAREKVLGQEHPDTLTSVNNFGLVLQYQGKYEEAEQMSRRALEGLEKVLGREHRDTLTSVNTLGLVLQHQGKYDEAEQMNRRALEGVEKVLGREHPDTLTSISNLSLVLQHQGKYEEAERMSRRALEAREKVLGQEHPDTLTSISNLAAMLQCQGKYEEAEQMNRRALEGVENVLGREHPDTLTSINNLSLVLQHQGKCEEAERMSRRALEAREKVLGQEHPDTLTNVSNLAAMLQYQGKYEEAEQMNRRVLEGFEKVLGREHPDTLTSVNNLGLVLQHQGKYKEAEQINRRALDAREKVLGREHPDTLTSINDLSLVLQHQGKYEEAELINRQALDAREKVLGREHLDTLTSVNTLGLVLQYQGKYEEAERMSRRALEGLERVLGREHPDTLTSVNTLGLVLQHQGKYEEAERMSRRALEGLERVLGREHRDTLASVNTLGLVLQYQGKYEEAERMSRRALEGVEKVLGREHPDTLTSISNLGLVLQHQGKYEEAERMNRRALEGHENVLVQEHSDTIPSVNNLGRSNCFIL
ncbi:Kinesin light chain [Fusarium oxysporum f. sp. rapae]|uniref:Kinesin light chain n=1 Tax=Fusarium oxysporum f. sp. rapae TaxID=485398 RepID=A0A8J5TM19_FUSOX|nr:Kinesin light chain [Fusarium oxysporum f. sp. rapae]